LNLPLVALIGRPNVGKSSLFNRFLQKKLAIVDARPGVTRDRNYAQCEWAGRRFYLIDTGGMVPGAKDAISRMVLDQAEIAIEQADLIVFIVDCQADPDFLDDKIAARLLKTRTKTLLLANKADNDDLELERFKYLSMGLGEPLPISATAGRGTGEALDAIIDLLPAAAGAADESKAIRIAVIGKPNVGKSLFINKLIGQERVIVSPVPGTTRDAVDTPLEFEGRRYILIDTAGLRKKAKVKEDIEYYTTLRSLRAVESCHIALVLIDAAEGVTFQDLKIIEDAVGAGRGIVMAVNKWDLIEKDTKSVDLFTAQVRNLAGTLAFIPLIFVSSLTGLRVAKTISLIDKVHENWTRKIATAELNRFVQEITRKQSPASVRGKYINLYYVTQTDIMPPTFLFFSNYPQLIQKNYLRYIENQLRQTYDFAGSPLKIKFRKK
jgi:GTP-binding protein